MKPKIEIVNIVATIKLEPMPDPKEILEKIPGSKPVKRFRGAMIRIGKTPVLFYRGSVVVSGAKTEEEIHRITDEVVRVLRMHGFTVRPVSHRIVNITAKVDLGVRLDLSRVAELLGGIYDPDLRPYATCRIQGVYVIITASGKIVVIGAKSPKRLLEVINLVMKKLLFCRAV